MSLDFDGLEAADDHGHVAESQAGVQHLEARPLGGEADRLLHRLTRLKCENPAEEGHI